MTFLELSSLSEALSAIQVSSASARFTTKAIFPLRDVYCLRCDQLAQRKITRNSNPNGNAGRPYYICPKCPRKDRFVTWDDSRGVHECNPLCKCGSASRQDRAGVDGERKGWGFWTCARGKCGYWSELRNGLTWAEMDANPNAPGSVLFLPDLL
ncbi:hypothetical protein BDV96DRAFT_580956 [Lophiotrema nucula]|uniref:GRF-like zinc ribbon domain-containing protein n=1 Tax=Lophiotrema nucula TaxID=690887 RepID=A0A6A5YXT0_9PLEO|nr:hypothetical protein BDV96DRAFT_580956 [Lophiotrema nucula]